MSPHDGGGESTAIPARRRLRGLAALRTDAVRLERVRLEHIKAKLRKRHSLYDSEADLLLRMLDQWNPKRPRSKVGAPSHVAVFHQWLAAHFVYLTEVRGIKKASAELEVCQKWDVTATTIVKALKRHRSEALALTRNFPDAFVSAPVAVVEENPIPTIVVEQMAATFKLMGSNP